MEIRLTETVQKGGCAAKLPADELREILSKINFPKSSHLLVGAETMDDAALWDLGDERYLVQTLDFFTPIVDDPKDFGRVAAANAISDIYAMGGVPKIALTILCFPASKLPLTLIGQMMEGALEIFKDAGMVLAGGHSIDDESIKLGFSVTGFVKKGSQWTNANSKIGDCLILTKPLGTGVIASAIKQKIASPENIKAAIQSMTTLNKLELDDVNSVTDVTGFGLAGHALQMARESGVTFRIECNSLPVLSGALSLIEKGILNRAHHTNFRYVKDYVDYSLINDSNRWLTLDPQTSGGLLLSVPKIKSKEILKEIRKRFPVAAIIGEVVDPTEKKIIFNF